MVRGNTRGSVWVAVGAFAMVGAVASCSGESEEAVAETTVSSPDLEPEETVPATTVPQMLSETEEPAAPAMLSQDPAHLGVGVVTLTSSSIEFNPDPAVAATVGTELKIDRAYSASAVHDAVAADGEKLVVVEYQVFTSPDVVAVNLASPFRLTADGVSYAPNTPVNQLLQAGDVVNDDLVFRVPETLTEFVLEAGAVSGAEGYTVTHDIALQADPSALAPVEARVAVPDAAVHKIVGISELREGAGAMAPNVSAPGVGSGPVVVNWVESSLTIRNVVRKPGEKFVIVNVTFTLTDGAAVNLSHGSFRLEADGELYTSINPVTEFLQNGQTAEVSLTYSVPRNAYEMVLYAGSLEGAPDGTSSNFSIVFEQDTAASNQDDDG